jgi:hypothetical protein
MGDSVRHCLTREAFRLFRAVSGRVLLSVVAVGMAIAPTPAAASDHGFDQLAEPIKAMLIKASDKALDKLARPGAFSADDTIRIVFPKDPGQADAVIRMAHEGGAIDSLQKTINDAAGQAAAEAKPVFRMSINRITMKDAFKILAHDDGATHYLWKTAAPELHARLHEIIRDTLARSGAFARLARLKQSGLLDRLPQMSGATPTEDFAPPNRPDTGDGQDHPHDEAAPGSAPPSSLSDFSPEGLTESVTDQAMDAIFKYIAHEEHKLRKDPSVLAPVLMKGMDR